MAIQSAEGIVLRRRPFRETSLIVTVFSREHGKIKILCKGVRKGKMLLAAVFEPLSRLHVVYYEKLRSDIHLLKEASLIDPHQAIKNRIDVFGHASYFSELMDVLFESHGTSADAYDLFLSALTQLAGHEPLKVARIFEIKLLHFLGWLPAMDGCSACGEKNIESACFNARQGGIVCSACQRKISGSFVLAKSTIQTFRYYQAVPFDQAVRINTTPNVDRELAKMSEKFFRYRLEYPLKTSRFLSELSA